MFSEFYFYNPSDCLLSKIETYLFENGFKTECINESEKRYKNDEKLVILSLDQDIFGKYIMVVCDKIDTGKICELLKKCPECESNSIIPIIPGILVMN